MEASGLDAIQYARIMGAGFWQNTTSLLPVSHFQTLLHYSIDGLDHIVQNQPRSDLVLADCVRFWPNGSYCANPAQIWFGSGWLCQVLAKWIILCKTSPDLIWFWLIASGFGQMDHIVQNQPRSDLVLADCVRFWPNGSYCAKPAQIWFGSGWLRQVLAKWIILCKTSPDLIWFWLIASGFGQMDHIVQNQPRSDLVLADCVRFWPNGSYCAKPAQIWFGSGWLRQVLAKWIRSGSKPMCKNHPAHFWPVFPS